MGIGKEAGARRPMAMHGKVDAILPAGGRIRGRFAAEAGTEVKALIAFDGRTLLERTLDVLRATGRIDRAVVVGPVEVAEHSSARRAHALLGETGAPTGNIVRGLEWLRGAGGLHGAERVLIMMTDLPFLTPAAVSGLLEACRAEADINLPLIRREEFDRRFPGAPRRYARLRDGHWLIGCAGVINPRAVERNRRHIERAFASRKSTLALASLLGLRFLIRSAFGRLGVDDIRHRCQQILGCTGHVVRHCAPELAFDIDRREDYRYAAAQIRGRASERVH